LSHGFESGDFVNLGLVFVNPLTEAVVGYNAGLLYGAQVTATINSGGSPTSVNGVLGGPTGTGYSVADGYGLIDAFAAYQKLKGATSTSAAK
jgi:hypothetical protein